MPPIKQKKEKIIVIIYTHTLKNEIIIIMYNNRTTRVSRGADQVGSGELLITLMDPIEKPIKKHHLYTPHNGGKDNPMTKQMCCEGLV